jgi:S1-C subfamily serine protease
MNLLDLVIILTALGAGLGGWRLGFVSRLFAWIGVAAGLAVAVHFVPQIVTTFGGTSADDRVTVALVFLVLGATIGQTLGLGAGALVHRAFPQRLTLPRWDRVAGAFVGVFGVFLLVWMVIPSLATAQGWPARMARGSWVVASIQNFGPTQPSQFAAWGRSISDAPYPSALGTLDEPPDPGRPPKTTLSRAVDARVRGSTVKVSGRACSDIQEGSGFVAGDGIVVTNAHVVAGEDATTVEDARGQRHDATVVAFDSYRDVAVLWVPTLSARPLPIAHGAVGDVGAVYGHPGGGALVASPAKVGEEIVAVGTDIYRTRSSRRHVYVLASSLKPGDSGGPLVDNKGNVIGLAFAIDPGQGHTAYALTDEEIRPVLARADGSAGDPVNTGDCLVE